MRLRLALVLVLALAPAAIAAKKPAYENNDTPGKAKTVKTGKKVKAGIDRIASPANTLTDDVDWFRWTAKKTKKTAVKFTNVGNKGVPCFGPVLSVLDAKQKFIKYVQPANDSSQSLRFSAKRGKRYFIRVAPHNVQQCDTPERYVFKIK